MKLKKTMTLLFAVLLMLNVIPAAAEETDFEAETDHVTEVSEEIPPEEANEETEPVTDTDHTEDGSAVNTDEVTEENQEEIISEPDEAEAEENVPLEDEETDTERDDSESEAVSDPEKADDLIPADGQYEAEESSSETADENEEPDEDPAVPMIEEEGFGETDTYNVLQDDLPDYNERIVTFDVDIKVGEITYKPDDFSEDMLLLIFFGSNQVEYTEQLVTECEALIDSGISLKPVLMLTEEKHESLLADVIAGHPNLMVSDNYNANYSYAYQLFNEYGLNGKLYPVSFLMDEERQFISGCNGICDKSRMIDRISRWAAGDHSFVESENKVFQVTIHAVYHQDEARSMFDMVNDFRTGDEAWAWNSSNTEKQYYNVSSLTYDYYLEYLAMTRAKEIISYYDPITHCTPDGRFNTRLMEPGVNENMCYGFDTAEEAFEYWKADNSSYSGQMQRRDMLDRNSMAVGLACIEYNGKKYWIQEFDNKIVTQTPITDMDTEEEHTVYVDRETVSLYLKFNDDIYNDSPEVRLYKGESIELPSAEAYFYTNSESSIFAGTVNNVRSSNENVAVVIGDQIIAKNPGTASIIYEGVFHELKGSIALNVTVDQKIIQLQSIALNKSSLNLDKGKSETLEVTYTPADTTDDKTVTWTSSNKSVATVSNGKVTAVGPGTTTITALVGTKTATCKVTVKVPLESISFNSESMNVVIGETETLSVKYDPADATEDKAITWTSSDESIAAVSRTGKVTGKAPGTATITANTAGGVHAECTIKVLFSDVTDPDLFYYDYVYDMVERGVVGGYDDGTFRPSANCNRAAVVTFLWRLSGKPDPTKMATFKDMTGNADFDKAISWAAENNITTGWEADNTFRPWNTCNRAAVMTFLWRAAGKPAPTKMAEFTDMTGNADFDKAISWASENNITTGWADGTFRPWNTCNRLAIVSFLARYNALKNSN